MFVKHLWLSISPGYGSNTRQGGGWEWNRGTQPEGKAGMRGLCVRQVAMTICKSKSTLAQPSPARLLIPRICHALLSVYIDLLLQSHFLFMSSRIESLTYPTTRSYYLFLRPTRPQTRCVGIHPNSRCQR